MKVVICTRCGSNELVQQGGYLQCIYCQSRFVPEADDQPARTSTIGVASDIERLLEQCRTDPANRRRYASRVLDIDPTNAEALEYLR